jgi:hypothetical protein
MGQSKERKAATIEETMPPGLDEEAARLWQFLPDDCKKQVWRIRNALPAFATEFEELSHFDINTCSVENAAQVRHVILKYQEAAALRRKSDLIRDAINADFRLYAGYLQSKSASMFIGKCEGPSTIQVDDVSSRIYHECEAWLTVAARRYGVLAAGAALDQSALQQLRYAAGSSATIDAVPTPGTNPKKTKGKAGRRGFSKEVKSYAIELRTADPELTAKQIRKQCLDKFDADDMPDDHDSFRRWMNR